MGYWYLLFGSAYLGGCLAAPTGFRLAGRVASLAVFGRCEGGWLQGTDDREVAVPLPAAEGGGTDAWPHCG